MKSRPSYLRVVKDLDKPVLYGVVGVERYGKKAYYAAFGPFATALEALRYSGGARDLHGYQAYEEYVAVAVYEDGAVHQVNFHESFEDFIVGARPLQELRRGLTYDLFTDLIERGPEA